MPTLSAKETITTPNTNEIITRNKKRKEKIKKLVQVEMVKDKHKVKACNFQ